MVQYTYRGWSAILKSWFGEGQDDQPWCSIHTGDGQLSLSHGLVKGRMISHGAVYIQGMVSYPYIMVW